MERLGFGKMDYGCKHYRRRCKIKAPCCNEVFSCRHCHNEEVSKQDYEGHSHELVRRDVKQVICAVCDAEQETSKGQFHCDDCGICRVGGSDNFYHCKTCGSCYSVLLRDNHLCVENSTRHHCPVCCEYLFDSLLTIVVLNCGHTMHKNCLDEMKKHKQYSCPICFKSVFDMSRVWRMMDDEIAATVMPEEYQHKKVWILCNDCSSIKEVSFHIIGHKCGNCNSYNTRVVAPPSTDMVQ
ncbi:unnamed protein product [Victoria cruziana]